MHLVMILAALGFTWVLRCGEWQLTGNWAERWQKALFLFLFPPLLLLMTALAVLCMGPQGQMIGVQASWFSYFLAAGFLGVAGVLGLKLAFEGWRSLRQVCTYSTLNLDGKLARILDTDIPFSAQVGFWQSELVVSRGLLKALDQEHLDAVLAHEQAHSYYRDTFWFFWLGWLRRMTAWLPNTEALWQELLVLRELRADGWAATQVDALLLAESLLAVVTAPILSSENFCAAFSYGVSRDRLSERIDALLAEPEFPVHSSVWTWRWVILTLLPLVTVPLHN